MTTIEALRASDAYNKAFNAEDERLQAFDAIVADIAKKSAADAEKRFKAIGSEFSEFHKRWTYGESPSAHLARILGEAIGDAFERPDPDDAARDAYDNVIHRGE